MLHKKLFHRDRKTLNCARKVANTIKGNSISFNFWSFSRSHFSFTNTIMTSWICSECGLLLLHHTPALWAFSPSNENKFSVSSRTLSCVNVACDRTKLFFVFFLVGSFLALFFLCLSSVSRGVSCNSSESSKVLKEFFVSTRI